jgi:hypothetical protein
MLWAMELFDKNTSFLYIFENVEYYRSQPGYPPGTPISLLASGKMILHILLSQINFKIR